MSHPEFAATLEYLYARLPMFQRIGAAAIKKDLTNTRKLLWALGLPQWRYPCIHIAGTNGKGSVSSMLASILTEAGYKTGLYTSPHLKSFTERIRVDGKAISEPAVVEWVAGMKKVIEQVEPSFFETTVALAFDHFARQNVDIAVIETGLGGRLDSTNVVFPELSIITQIGYDHMDLLGDTLAAIAAEKAGIIKPYTPVVIGEYLPETRPVFELKAASLSAPVIWAQEEWSARSVETHFPFQEITVTHLRKNKHSTFRLDLPGHYQTQNLATVLSSVEALRRQGWKLPKSALKRGLSHVRKNAGLRGRMEMLSSAPLVIADIGHNESGVQAAMAQVLALPVRHRHMVWGMVNDKDHDKVLRLLPKDATWYFVRPDIPRGLDAAVLRQKAEAHGLTGEVYPSVAEGKRAALAAAAPNDLVYIGGSTFVVAEAID